MIASGPREIGDTQFRLREITPADSPHLYRWRMDPSSRPMFRQTEEVSFAAHEAYLARYFSRENTDRWFVMEAQGRPVGAVALYGIAPGATEAEWGRLIVPPEERGHGFAYRGFLLLIEDARRIGLTSVFCEILQGNTVVERIHERLGFFVTGRTESGGRVFQVWTLLLSAT